MPTITFEANEHSALRVELRGLAASYAAAEIVLAGGPAYSDAPTATWASVAGVAVGDGEVAGYDLPLPQLEPGRYTLEVYAATPGERRADIMPAPGETIVLKVGDRRHDNADTTPPAQVTVQQGTSEVRAGDGGKDVRLYVRDPSGTRLDSEATHTIAASPLVVPTAGEVDVPTTYQEAMAAGYDGTAAEFYAALVAQPSAGAEWESSDWHTDEEAGADAYLRDDGGDEREIYIQAPGLIGTDGWMRSLDEIRVAFRCVVEQPGHPKGGGQEGLPSAGNGLRVRATLNTVSSEGRTGNADLLERALFVHSNMPELRRTGFKISLPVQDFMSYDQPADVAHVGVSVEPGGSNAYWDVTEIAARLEWKPTGLP